MCAVWAVTVCDDDEYDDEYDECVHVVAACVHVYVDVVSMVYVEYR